MEKLKQAGAKNIIISGIESHVCVLQTAVDLKEAGFNPIVVMDCISCIVMMRSLSKIA